MNKGRSPVILGRRWLGIGRIFLLWIWWKLGMRLLEKVEQKYICCMCYYFIHPSISWISFLEKKERPVHSPQFPATCLKWVPGEGGHINFSEMALSRLAYRDNCSVTDRPRAMRLASRWNCVGHSWFDLEVQGRLGGACKLGLKRCIGVPQVDEGGKGT